MEKLSKLKIHKNEKNILISVIIVFTVSFAYGQNSNTEKIWRVNFLNPAIELELPTGNSSTFSAGLGIGYGGHIPT